MRAGRPPSRPPPPIPRRTSPFTSLASLAATASWRSSPGSCARRGCSRSREREEAARRAPPRRLGSARLLTLTGAGGSGKTRLAEEVALRAAASFDVVGWIDFAPVNLVHPLAQ